MTITTTAATKTMAPASTVPVPSLADYLYEGAQRYDRELAGMFPRSACRDLNRYLYDPLRNSFSSGGKHLRPLLCELGCAIVGGQARDARCTALAIESFHMAALIHDDIEDGAQLRHGQECLHRREGKNVAINAGDYALSLVNKIILAESDYPGELKLKILEEMADMVTWTIEGQALDIGWSRDVRHDVGIDDYLKMAASKSAHYSISYPLAIGAIVGGGSSCQVEALRLIGLKLGIAFQLKDDLIDIEGQSEVMGKSCLADIREGKLSYPIVYALNASGASDELLVILRGHTTDRRQLARAVEIIAHSGALESGRARMSELCCEAVAELESSFAPSPARSLLASVSELVQKRVS